MSGVRRGVYILPNMFTTASLFCGFFAILRALESLTAAGKNLKVGAVLIIAAALFDGLDGRVARKTGTASKFGTEYDSLSDLVSFGVAPALMLYAWTLRDFGRTGWLAAFVYLACGALRLARFNVQSGTVEKKFFQGLPIPMAALIVAGAVLIWDGNPVRETTLIFSGDVGYFLLGLTYLLGGLMVSSIPYRSFKTLKLTDKHPFYRLVFVVVGFIIWATRPWWVLFLLGCIYLLSGPVEQYILSPPVRVYRRAKKRRRVKKSLDRIDEIVSQTGEAGETDPENLHRIQPR